MLIAFLARLRQLTLVYTTVALSLAVFLTAAVARSAGWPPERPRLVVFIVIDQFRADYLTRFHDEFGKDGFNALIKNGAYYPFGQYDILQSMTGPGHATVLTGAYPYQMGIPLNDWYDPASSNSVYCVEDPDFETLGAPSQNHLGTSPRHLIGTTVGDELKNSGLKSKVVTLALKDRAAILMGGHRADLAFWFDADHSRWVTSRYYIKKGPLPKWLEDLNSRVKKCDLATPCGAEMTVTAFKAALSEMQLGQSKDPDLIALSFSGHDLAGHKFGANSEELHQMTLSEDQAIAQIRAAVAQKVPGGLNNVLFILTGDHGVAPSPKYLADTGIESGQISESQLKAAMEEDLKKEFGPSPSGAWIPFVNDFNFFLNEETIRAKKLDIEKVEGRMKAVLQKDSRFAQVFSESDLLNNKLPPGMFERQIKHTYYKGRSGHVIGLVKPFYINSTRNEANHMTGYSYDRTVPILFSGFGIQAGVYSERAEVIDIAPTLSFILGLIPPALSEGRVLSEALKTSARPAKK